MPPFSTVDTKGRPRQGATAGRRPSSPSQHGVPREPGCTIKVRNHGTLHAFRKGCRCGNNRESWRLYSKRRREGRNPARQLDPTGLRRRVQAARAMGWDNQEIATRAGVPPQSLSRLCQRPPAFVTSYFVDKVQPVVVDLMQRPGPSEKAKAYARRHGWFSIAAWDNIDDPNERPKLGSAAPGKGRDTEWLEAEVTRLAAARVAAPQIAEECGCSVRTVERIKARQRAGEASQEAA